MAIAANETQVQKKGFVINATSADLSGTEELKAAPGAGKFIHVTSIDVVTAATITVTIGAGETGGAVTTAILGPSIAFTAALVPWRTQFIPAIKLAANTALTVDASGAGAVHIVVQGFVE